MLFVSNIRFSDCFALFTNSKLVHLGGYIANACSGDTDCFLINDFTVLINGEEDGWQIRAPKLTYFWQKQPSITILIVPTLAGQYLLMSVLPILINMLLIHVFR